MVYLIKFPLNPFTGCELIQSKVDVNQLDMPVLILTCGIPTIYVTKQIRKSFFFTDYPTDNLLDEISRNIYQPEKFLVGDLHIARELFEKYLPASSVHRKCSLQMMNMWYETNAGNNSLDNLRECINSGFRRKAISRDEYEALNDTIQSEFYKYHNEKKKDFSLQRNNVYH